MHLHLHLTRCMSRLIVSRSIMLLNKWIACVPTTMPSYPLWILWIGKVVCCCIDVGQCLSSTFFSHVNMDDRSILNALAHRNDHIRIYLFCLFFMYVFVWVRAACRVYVCEWVSLLNTITIKQIILSIAFALFTARDTWRWCPDIIGQWQKKAISFKFTCVCVCAAHLLHA